MLLYISSSSSSSSSTVSIAFLTAVRAVSVAKPVILNILPSTSVLLLL